MKILYISNAVVPSETSQSLSIMRVCQAFADARHEVMLDAVAGKNAQADPVAFYGLRGGFTVKCERFPPLLYNDFTCWQLGGGLLHALRTRPLFDSFRPDLVYSRLTVSELACVPKNIPFIYEMHSLGALGQTAWRRFVFQRIMRGRNVVRIVVTTDSLAALLKDEFPGIDIVVARLSAEPPVAIPAAVLTDFRKRDLQGSFTHNVGYTGFLDTYGLRGTDIICQTAARMPETGFHIVGGEPDAVAYWKQYAADYNTHGNIFFYGHRNPAEIPYFLNLFDVVLAPLQYRPNKRAPAGQNMSPLKLPQYMAYGKAIVASDIPAHREVLEDEKTALLVPHDDAGAWAASIGRYIDSSDLRRQTGEAAHMRYRAEFTPERRIARILAGL